MKLRVCALLAICFLSFSFVSDSFAQLPPGIYSECDFCGCSMGISPLMMNGSSISFTTRYTELSQQYLNGKLISFPTDQSYVSNETYFTNMLSLRGELTDQLSATLMVPFKHTAETVVDPGMGSSTISDAGVGDLSLILQDRLVSDHEWADMRVAAVTAGVKFANGSTALLNQGQPADPDAQLGTGTTDFYAGLSGLLAFSNWNIQVDAIALLHGFGNGANGHTYGSSLNYDAKAEYRLYIDPSFQPSLPSPTVFASFAIQGEARTYETQNGQPLDNDSLGWSGGNVVYAAPGLDVFFAPRVSLDAAVWIPVIHALYGNQLGETVKAMVGIQVGM